MESALEAKVRRIASLVDIGKFIDGDKNAPSRIRWYYRINDAAYRRFHSDRRFMHFRVSEGETLRENDIFYQPDTIARYISKDATVLELGPGQGANIFYLAKKFPDAHFIGVDLMPPKIKKDTPKNIRFRKGDYNSLAFLPDASIDVAYGIETIVHCSDKERVFSEVFRVLKPGGVFVVYDYALRRELSTYSADQQTAVKLISKCGASAMIESADAWKTHFEACGFTVISTTDLTRQTLPDLARLSRLASKIFDHKTRTKLLFRLAPRIFTGNVIIGYLSWDSANEEVGYYNEWIYRKSE